MLTACGLTRRYDSVLALDDVSFEIRPGEILGYRQLPLEFEDYLPDGFDTLRL